jgi:MFS family permease
MKSTDMRRGVAAARRAVRLAHRQAVVAPPTQERPSATAAHGWRAGLSRTVLVLAAASFCTDIASEMVAPLRLLFLVQVLGAPLAIAGLIEGIAEATTAAVKLGAGSLADRPAARRPLVIAGYALSNAAKPLLALVSSWQTALGLVLLDRSGKSLRGSPRDAMLADAAPSGLRGKVFGVHRSADTLGAAIGPLCAALLLALPHGSLRGVFAWTALPGMMAVLVVLVFLRPIRPAPPAPPLDTRAAHAGGERRERLWQGLGQRFWLFLAISTVFALGNSSDAFLFLRSEGVESSLIAVPLLYFVFNAAYALLATPLGALSDRWGRLPLLGVGYAAFTLVYLGWTQVRPGSPVWALFLVYAVYYAATDGVARAFVTDLVPARRRGRALGWLSACVGLAALPANLVAAWVWSQWGPGATFALGAWLGAVTLALLIVWWPWLRLAPGSATASTR